MLDNFIIKKILKCKKCVRIVAITVMVCACFYLVYRTHIVFNIEPVYTHFFYIPSLLAVIWWRKKGLIVPIVISVMLLSAMADSLELSHHVINDFFQTMVLISVSIMTLFFIERMDKGVKEKGIFINSLKESEEKFKVLFESSQDALMTLSPPAWKFNSVNKTGTKLFGVSSKEEFLSKAPWEYSPEYQ
ncbi:MAG: hypothetical protein KKD35_04045, partial [Elusimicrobia bacterium]|nr:hypothetical protein [Elusimicrobiota bacterium]